MDDGVFRSLADPTRRRLLDLLRETEPQTLGALVDAIARTESMTRFGVMKHLAILEDAGLVISRKVGREKLHYLNPAPIQQLADRWISRFASPLVRRMADVKTLAEAGAPPMSAPRQVYETFIRADAQAIWRALTDPRMTVAYYFGSRVESDLKPGSPFRYFGAESGRQMIEGEVVACDPPRRLVTTFSSVWSEETKGDRPSRVTWEITPMDGFCKLTLTHDDFDGETVTYTAVAGGWSMILAGLKTLLETGEPLKKAG